MIRISSSGGRLSLSQPQGSVRMTQKKGLVTFKFAEGQSVTPPVYKLDFSQAINSMYLTIF